MMRNLWKFCRKFFRTPLFPLEAFAENEKYTVIWKKYKNKCRRKVYFRKQVYAV